MRKSYHGKPCKKCGGTERYACNNRCVVCSKAAVRAYDKKHAADRLAYRQRYRAANVERVREWARASMRRQRDKNPEKFRARDRARYAAGYRMPRSAKTSAQRKREAGKRQQVCACCNAQAFNEVYARAAEAGLQVDHVVPLALGGQHCCKNLQLLTEQAHKEKTKRDRDAMRAVRRRQLLIAKWTSQTA